MSEGFWHWLIHAPGGLAVRIGAGVVIFTILALVDIRRHGQQARRWREYLFLVVCVVVAMAYGIANNMVTLSISWEYYYGKNLHEALGPPENLQPWPLRREAIRIGMMATWSVGLLLGVAVLLANNPRRNLPQLPFRSLYWMLPLVFAGAVVGGVLGGVVGFAGWLRHASKDLMDVWLENMFRPRYFLAAWGTHLGGYAGSALATIGCVPWIIRRRRRLADAIDTPEECSPHGGNDWTPPAEDDRITP